MKIEALAAHEPGIEVKPFTYEPGPVGEFECIVKVIACGICASDLTTMKTSRRFPMVPGHEVAGEVVEVGSAVKQLKVGAHVGIGWQSGACLECDDCLRGRENLCDQSKALITHGYGGFGRYVKVDARFAFALPKGIEPKMAGPLMCAGATVYGALRSAGMTSGQRIGVVGVGGLGHLAVQFASKLGNHVTAFTSSADKAEFASSLGAKDAVVVPRGGAIPGAARKLDVILLTTSEGLDWGAYLNQLGTGGTIVNVAVDFKPAQIPLLALLGKGRRIMASLIGSRATINEMLMLAERHEVRPIIETFPMANANEALARVSENKVRYRAVLEA